MRKQLFWCYLLIGVFIFAGLPVFAQDTEDITDDRLTVAIKVFEPFVMKDGDTWTGFSIELWEDIAQKVDLEFDYLEVETVRDQLDAVEDGSADLAIAGISITSVREERVDFSQPYFDAGLQILTVKQSAVGLLDLLMVLLSPTMLQVFGFFLASVIVAAHIIWLVERKNNPDFPKPYLQGIGEALWWSVVTVTTVGYGDKSPKGLVGRLFGVVWMLMGLFLIANFTAGVTSAITLQELRGSINTLADLQGRRIGTVEGSTSVDFLRDANLFPRTFTTIDDAYTAIEYGHLDAIVYDAPVLLYYATNTGTGQMEVVGETFNVERYGIAFPQGSDLLETVNLALLDEVESGQYQTLQDSYFGG